MTLRSESKPRKYLLARGGDASTPIIAALLTRSVLEKIRATAQDRTICFAVVGRYGHRHSPSTKYSVFLNRLAQMLDTRDCQADQTREKKITHEGCSWIRIDVHAGRRLTSAD